MATKIELIARWDAFLNKMEQRYLESLVQAEDACLAQLEETDYDYYTVVRSWQGMKAQINHLIPKIDETWKNKVKPQMKLLDDGSSFYIDERNKASELTEKLHEKIERFELVLEGKLSQLFYDHAIEIANKDFNCSQCDAPIHIKKDVFRAQYITCQFCNTVNTFEPEAKIMQVGWDVIDNIVALKCLKLKDQMDSACEKADSKRIENQTDEDWEAYKTTYLTYWETFFKERIKLKSDAQERYEADMERKKVEFVEYENIQRYNKYGVN